MRVPGSEFTKELDSLAGYGDRKPKGISENIKTSSQKSHLRFRRPSMQQKTLNSNSVVGEYAPVANLVQDLQITEDPRNIPEDQKLSASKRPSGFKRMDCIHKMTLNGEKMNAIDEHENEQSSEANFSPMDFGEDSPDSSVSEPPNFPNNFSQAPGSLFRN